MWGGGGGKARPACPEHKVGQWWACAANSHHVLLRLAILGNEGGGCGREVGQRPRLILGVGPIKGGGRPPHHGWASALNGRAEWAALECGRRTPGGHRSRSAGVPLQCQHWCWCGGCVALLPTPRGGLKRSSAGAQLTCLHDWGRGPAHLQAPFRPVSDRGKNLSLRTDRIIREVAATARASKMRSCAACSTRAHAPHAPASGIND